MYRCSLYKYLGQLPVVPAVGTIDNWFLCWIFWLVQWYLTTPLTAFSYFNALHTSLAKIQSLSLMVTTHNSTALKVNGMTEDIFFSSCLWRNICVSITDIKFFTKLSVIISIHSPNQEVPGYPHECASILQEQKLYRIRPANRTEHDYLVAVQFDLIDTYFYSR